MSTASLIALDLLVAIAAAAAWLGAGAALAARRAAIALGLFVVAILASVGRLASVAVLATAGWWFVQEKVTLALPLLMVCATVATVLAAPMLLSHRQVRLGGDGNTTRAEDHDAPRPAVVVALLTTGYAATAGLAVTFPLGYPATWSRGLIIVGVVAAAALTTWRVVAGSDPRLRLVVAAATALLLTGVGLAFLPIPDAEFGGGPAAADSRTGAVAVTALRGPDPADLPPGSQVRRFTLTASTATITLASGRSVEAWTYNGQSPGPALTAIEGDLIEVTLRNADIADGVTLHWHGYDVPSGEDGVPGLTQDLVAPGQEFVYRFRADQVGTYWYHTHSVSDPAVRRGLFGTLVVTPPGPPAAGLDLTLPVHTFGDTVALANDDRPTTKQAAPGTPVRMRLINTDSTPHRFALTGVEYQLIAVDGTDLNEPGPLAEVMLTLPAGGRYDLAFAMPAEPVALLIDNKRDGAGLRLLPEGGGDADVVADPSGWPELDLLQYGRPAETPFNAESHFDREFTLVLDRGLAALRSIPGYAHTVNGHAYPVIPEQVVRENDLVRVTVVNRSFELHPWHLHGHHVLVLRKNGQTPTGSPLWHDTFDVRPGDVWEVAFRADNPGQWMNHCHNLPHAAKGMALHLAYEGVTTPFHGDHA